MSASPHIRPSKDKDAAAVLVGLLQPGAWIPPAHARWLPVIEALLEPSCGTDPSTARAIRPLILKTGMAGVETAQATQHKTNPIVPRWTFRVSTH